MNGLVNRGRTQGSYQGHRPHQRLFTGVFLGLSLSPLAFPTICTAEPDTPPSEEATKELAPATPAATSPQKLASLSDMGIEDLMNLEVTTVSRQESTVGQSPAAVFVISQDMIRRSGATAIPELFRMVPGLNVARTNGGNWAVSARGFNSNIADKLLVQVDGRTVYNPVFSGVYWDTVDYPLEDIERIEVVRGPGASVWGANAVNGIINIITKTAADTQGLLLSAGIGSQDRAIGTMRYGAKGGKDWNYRVYTKGIDRNDEFSSVFPEHDKWRHERGGFRIDRKASERDSMTFQGDYYESDAEGTNIIPTLTSPFAFLNQDTDQSKGTNLLFRWNREQNKEKGWQLQAYYDRFDRETQNGYIAFKAETFDLDFQHHMMLGKRHKFIYGLGYRTVNFSADDSVPDNGLFATFPDEHSTTHLASAFAQDEIILKPEKLSLTLGSKFEHNSFTGFEVEPTARLLWTPTKRQSVWLSASRAVRTPNFIERGFDFTQVAAPLPPFVLLLQLMGSPGFDSETVKAYEAGYRAQVSDRFSVDTALFYNDYDNLKAIDVGTLALGSIPGTLVLPLLSTNQMTGQTYGFEASANLQVSKRWKLYGAYSYLHMHLHPGDGISPLVFSTADVAEGQSPRHQVFLRSSWDLPNNLELDLSGRYVSRLTRTDPVTPSYYSMDVRLGWKPRGNDGLEFAVVGQNLLDRHHPEFGSNVEMRRGIYGMVTYRH